MESLTIHMDDTLAQLIRKKSRRRGKKSKQDYKRCAEGGLGSAADESPS